MPITQPNLEEFESLRSIARRIAVDLEPPVASPVPYAIWNRPKATEMVLEQLAPLIVRVNDVLSQAELAIDRAMSFTLPYDSRGNLRPGFDPMTDYVNEVCGKIRHLREELSHVQP